ncbi:hypothetical protein FQN57_002259 [Myotisia sp. PD_48]|nr:hypothetical protein FQN57_002259 [Myotisia sp. PD_48]
MAPKSIKVKPLTAADVVRKPLVKYIAHPDWHVQSKSIHALWYLNPLKPWISFEEEVLASFNAISWSDFQQAIAIEVLEDADHDFHLETREHSYCEEEISISGRFVQQALHPMSAVSQLLGYKMVFGDFKATSKGGSYKLKEKGPVPKWKKPTPPMRGSALKVDPGRKQGSLIPDYALMTDSGAVPRAVGEVKTLWTHNFKLDAAEIFETDKPNLRRLFGKYLASQKYIRISVFQAVHFSQCNYLLGQIGRYMIELELKYGFITNFDHTIFLKREFENGEEVMYFSTPIAYDSRQSDNKSITIRQGLLFLEAKVQEGEMAWHAKSPPKNAILAQKKDQKINDIRNWLTCVDRSSSDSDSSDDESMGGLVSGSGARNIPDTQQGASQPARQVRFDTPHISSRPQRRGRYLGPYAPEKTCRGKK